MKTRNVGARGRTVFGVLLAAPLYGDCVAGWATPLSSQARARLSAGQATLVIVEFDATATDRAASGERARRRLLRDDDAILAMRSQGYAAIKLRVMTGVAGPDAARLRDYHCGRSRWPSHP
jgi:hypothetical protein